MYDNVSTPDLLDLSVRANSLVAHAQALLDAGQLPVSTWGFPLDCLTGLADDVNAAIEARGPLVAEGADGSAGDAGEDDDVRGYGIYSRWPGETQGHRFQLWADEADEAATQMTALMESYEVQGYTVTQAGADQPGVWLVSNNGQTREFFIKPIV